MAASPPYTKHLCMSSLEAQHNIFRHSQHMHTAAPKEKCSSFGFVIRGSVSLITSGNRLDVPEGHLFYLPEGVTYRSLWTGNPHIEFYSLHIASPRLSSPQNDRRYAVQMLSALSCQKTADIFAEIYRLLREGDRVSGCRALSLYYAFFADALSYMKTEEAPPLPATLKKALDYIEAHCEEDLSVAELAALVSVSESALFRQFRTCLSTTPITVLNEARVCRSLDLLRDETLTVSRVSDLVGFHSPIYFREVFHRFTGLTPSAYRKSRRFAL